MIDAVKTSENQLRIDFSLSEVPEILGALPQQLPPWQQEIRDFLEEWSRGGEVKIKSSGTTGEPKVFSIPLEYLEASAKKTIQYFGLEVGHRVQLCLSPQFVASKLMIVRAIVGRMVLICHEPSNDPLKYLDEPVDFSAWVPSQLLKTLKNRFEALKNVKVLIIGGGELPESVRNDLEGQKTRIFATYGMSETLTHIAVRPCWPEWKEEYDILSGIEIGQNDEGCLRLKYPEIGIREWMDTKDLIEIKPSSKFVWKGRKDNVINSGGVKVYSEEVEREIKAFIDDQEFIVVGVKDEQFGERPVLIVELEGASYRYLNRLMVFLRNGPLDRIKRPDKIIVIDQFERTSSGKIKRKTLEYLKKAKESYQVN